MATGTTAARPNSDDPVVDAAEAFAATSQVLLNSGVTPAHIAAALAHLLGALMATQPAAQYQELRALLVEAMDNAERAWRGHADRT